MYMCLFFIFMSTVKQPSLNINLNLYRIYNFMKLNKIIKYAPEAWKNLNGIFCVYKPPSVSIFRLINLIKSRLVKELNEFECRPINIIDNNGNKSIDYADHILSVGPRYIKKEIIILPLPDTTSFMSGVSLLTLNTDTSNLLQYQECREINVYECSGKFGKATADFTINGKTVLRTKYDHITTPKFERVLSVMLANHQRQLINYMGIDIRSQKAYKLASQNLIRPIEVSPPIITGIRLIKYDRPDFTIEISCVNEEAAYLCKVIHDLALTLKCSAHCTKLRRIRMGPFHVDNALSSSELCLQNIMNNLAQCRPKFLGAINEAVTRSLRPSAHQTLPELLSSKDNNMALV